MAKWTPETPWVKSNKKTLAEWPTYVCRNPSCKSYGRSHPNCQCGHPGTRTDRSGHPSGYALAHGGKVGADGHFCGSDCAHDPSCEHFADGGLVEENREMLVNPALAIDHAIANHGLLHALTKTGRSKSENLNKPAEDFIDHSRNGRRLAHAHAASHLDPGHKHVTPSKGETESLRKHIDALRTNPSALLETGGNLGLMEHSSVLAAKAATAMDYFEAIKPKMPLPGPMDQPLPPSKIEEQNYERQLGLAERPLSILARAKDGTIQPADIQTVQTLYPDLYKSIQEKAFESLVAAQSKGTEIPYKQKIGISMLLGQPLDATMTQSAMQSIMRANAGAQVESQGPPAGRSKTGATAATQKTIAKMADLYKTPLEKIQTGK